MASVARDRNGTKRVLFVDGDGARRTIRLGDVQVKAAESFRLRVETLLACRTTGTPIDGDTARWLADLPDAMHARLACVGLVEPRERAAAPTLGMLLGRFAESAVVKPVTLAAYRQAIGSLREHFGDDAPLNTITPARADGWRKALAESTLAPATVAKRVNVAKTIFRKAVRWGLIPSSPFADLRAGSQSNPDRAHYVDAETTRAVLAACPDDQWRAIVALSRYAGLRCPSEVVGLTWGDVNWERGRLTVRSPKTAGHDGHAVRVVPIAPELRPILLALFVEAEPGVEPVVPRLRDPATNLRTHFLRIIGRAGVKPWPRLFHNMRASCATDWVERFPAHVVAGWLGHSPMIAAQHYLQTRDAHFDLAAGVGEAAAKAAANPATQARTSDPTDEHAERGNTEKHADLVGVGVGCDAVEIEPMGAAGFEPAKA